MLSSKLYLASIFLSTLSAILFMNSWARASRDFISRTRSDSILSCILPYCSWARRSSRRSFSSYCLIMFFCFSFSSSILWRYSRSYLLFSIYIYLSCSISSRRRPICSYSYISCALSVFFFLLRSSASWRSRECLSFMIFAITYFWRCFSRSSSSLLCCSAILWYIRSSSYVLASLWFLSAIYSASCSLMSLFLSMSRIIAYFCSSKCNRVLNFWIAAHSSFSFISLYASVGGGLLDEVTEPKFYFKG